MTTIIQHNDDGKGNVTDTKYSIYSTVFKPTDILINPTGLDALVAQNVDPSQWTLSGTYDAPVVSQLAASDYTAQLQTYQAQVLEKMGLAVSDYIMSRYPDRVQRSLGFLYTESVVKNQPDVTAAVQKAWDWTVTVIQGFYWFEQQVLAAQTIDDVNACTLDLTLYNATDPMVTMDSVLALQGLQVPVPPPAPK